METAPEGEEDNNEEVEIEEVEGESDIELEIEIEEVEEETPEAVGPRDESPLVNHSGTLTIGNKVTTNTYL